MCVRVGGWVGGKNNMREGNPYRSGPPWGHLRRRLKGRPAVSPGGLCVWVGEWLSARVCT